jgi:hypothetical protein
MKELGLVVYEVRHFEVRTEINAGHIKIAYIQLLRFTEKNVYGWQGKYYKTDGEYRHISDKATYKQEDEALNAAMRYVRDMYLLQK